MPFITETIFFTLWIHRNKKWWEVLEKVILAVAFIIFGLSLLYVGYHWPMTLIFFDYPLELCGLSGQLDFKLWD
jgi:hypothetical protein